jgi:uncharacterized protein YndB with AHSA1/START domain
MASSIHKLITIGLPQNESNLLLLEGSSVATWFGADRANIDPRVGGDYEVFWKPGTSVDSTEGCKIVAMDSESFVVSWRGPTKHVHFPVMESVGSTSVGFFLSSEGEQTKIAVRHEGFGSGQEWEQARQYYEERWNLWAHNLELLGKVACRIKTATDMARTLSEASPAENAKSAISFIAKPAAGARRRFDFSQISLTGGTAFGNDTVLRNVADQA